MTPYRVTRGADSSVRPIGQLVVFLGVLLAGYGLVHGETWPQAQAVLNGAGPASLFVACLVTAVRLLAVNRMVLLTPLLWFLAACGMFFGIGPLACLFADSETLAYMNQLWVMNADNLWQTNVLNAVGMLTILCAFLAVQPFLSPRVADVAVAGAARLARSECSTAKLALAIFLGIGLPMRYLVALPYEFGQLNLVLPGSILTLQELVLIGLLVLSYLSVRESPFWMWILVPLLALELTVAFLQFNKSTLLLILVMVCLGRYLAHGRGKEIVLWAGLCVLVYVLVAPIVTACRNEAIRASDDPFGHIPLPERLEITEKVLRARLAGEPEVGELKQGWWSRLCYAPPQAFALDQYDTGSPGDSFQGALYTFVPRFLWPEKPIVTDIGVDFTQLCLGHRYSLTTMGVFAEAYWNGGWLWVVLTCSYIGVLFAFLSRLNLLILARADWLLLPCAFWGLKIGFRIDGWFVADYVGAVVLYLAYFGIFSLLRLGLPSTRLAAPRTA